MKWWTTSLVHHVDLIISPSSDLEHRCKHLEKEKSMGINTVRLHIYHHQIVGTGSSTFSSIFLQTQNLGKIVNREGMEWRLGREKNLRPYKKNDRDWKRDKAQGSHHRHMAEIITGKGVNTPFCNPHLTSHGG